MWNGKTRFCGTSLKSGTATAVPVILVALPMIGDDTEAASRRTRNCIRKKCGEERFTTWQLEFSFHF